MSDLSKKLRKTIKAKPPLVTRPEILLSQNIPAPMHGVAPRVVFGKKWWNTTRQESYRSTGYRCLACGVHKLSAQSRQWLEGHELYRIDYAKGQMRYLETVPLCHYCHNYIHDGRLHALLQRGEVTHRKFVAVIQHGDRVLADASMFRPTHTERVEEVAAMLLDGKVAPWAKWRLCIGRRRFPPKFKTETQWRLAMEKQ